MFETAIEEALQYTRPLHTITRTYGGLVVPGSSTFFFVNNNGVAITCKHVAEMIPAAEKINAAYHAFKKEKNALPRDGKYNTRLKGLELKYHYEQSTTVQVKNNFLNCFDKLDEIKVHIHPTLDLAILEFKGFNRVLYTEHAIFLKDTSKIKQGNYLCRIGFPFPEYTNFLHNAETDDIEWTNTGNTNSPVFPLDGIVTRFLGSAEGVNGIEMSTPGLRGQSGGPLFDREGKVYGMQFATNHLHLGFDIEQREIIRDGNKMKVSNNPFLHVGLCVHAEQIKQFLRQHQIEFLES
jgi:hypothetical protein